MSLRPARLLLLTACLGLAAAPLSLRAGDPAPPPEAPERPGLAPATDDPEAHGPRGPWHGPEPLTPEEIDRAIEVLERIDPETAEHARRVREQSPERLGRVIRHRFPQMGEFLALQRYAPEMFELRVQDLQLAHESRRLADRIQHAQREDDDDKADRLTERLEQKVAEHFDVRQQIRERELADLEARVERLREQLEQRADHKDDLIEDRLRQLTTGEAADW